MKIHSRVRLGRQRLGTFANTGGVGEGLFSYLLRMGRREQSVQGPKERSFRALCHVCVLLLNVCPFTCIYIYYVFLYISHNLFRRYKMSGKLSVKYLLVFKMTFFKIFSSALYPNKPLGTYIYISWRLSYWKG